MKLKRDKKTKKRIMKKEEKKNGKINK